MTRNYCTTYLQTYGMQNITFFTVLVEQQSNTGVTVRVIFDRSYFRWYVMFIPPKIDNPIEFFTSATPMATGNHASIVPTFGTVFRDC